MEKQNKTDLMRLSTTLTIFLESKEYKGLSVIESEIVTAVNGIPIRNYEVKDLENALLVLIGKTHLNMYGKFEESHANIANATISELASDLKTHNGYLTFNEIELAFKNGYKGEYGEVYGLNNRMYFQWINAYQYGQNRCKVLKLIAEAKEKQANPKPKLSEMEKDKIMRDFVLKSFDEFKETGVLIDFGNTKYNYLDNLGLITFTTEVKKKIMENCRQRIIAEKKEETAQLKLQRQPKHLSELSNSIVEILENGEMTPQLIAASKREALKIYFQNLIEFGEDLKEILNEKSKTR